MRRTNAILAFVIATVACGSAFGQSGRVMQKRMKQVKEGTVRVLIKGNPVGTGFAVREDLVVTAFHVVQQATPADGGQTRISYASNIEIQLYDGRRLVASPHPSCTGQNFQEALGKDVALLTVSEKVLRPLRLGHFADVSEGDSIYIAGYPFGLEQPIVATGMLSTKWKTPGYLGQGAARDVAWLDITMNKGNSGGPVLLLAEDPSKDAVIGIANFSLNPFAQTAEEFAGIAAAFPGNVMIMGIDFKKFATVIGAALGSQSHGVGGCIAIDSLVLPKP